MSTVTTKDVFISVQEAAELIGCTRGRVRQLLIDEEILGEKLGERTWAVVQKSAEKYAKREYTTGRPRQGV